MEKITHLTKLAMFICALLSLTNTYSQCGISTFPYTEGFENTLGAWTQDTGDVFDWTNDSGGTPSEDTGPTSAHGGNYYMFTETSSPRSSGDTANFVSPCFDLTNASAAQFSFWYNMYGEDMGTLYLELSTDNGTTYPNLLWSLGGDQGNSWNQVNIDLLAYVGNEVKIRFRGVRGNGWQGDMAIDDVLLDATTFFDGDSDFDGVNDSVDIDDDNDGILDTDECTIIVNPPLANADFEDLDIITSGLDGGATDVVGTSGIWKGDATNIPNWLSADTSNNYLEIWHNSQGAGNDAGGQAYSGTQWAEVNATTNDGLYQDVVSTPGDVLQWSFAHRKRTGYSGSSNEDIVRLMIGDASGTLIDQGDFSSAGDSSWTLHSGTYTVPAGQTTTRLTFTVINSASGSTSSGNFIDNVQLFVIPATCTDTDSDSIPDYFDLDSDNDGIPDIVEAGFGSASLGTAKIPLSSFTDANGNGMHDAFENTSPLDSDNDGVPNYLDLDSDNDTVFDVDEARTARYVFSTLTFENGDGDINGDGVGDGLETEAFRAKDDDNDGNLEYFGDGILDIYDYGTGANEYGNLSQGSAPHYVADTDNDGIPDYIDTTSDGLTFDISNTHYADLDANNDGLIDDTTDSDDDGIVDLFDTNDVALGSPRDLQKKLDLYFDGRNDYVEDTNVMSGWSEATLMAWIKLDPAATGTQVIMGQDAFYLQINSNLEVEAKANGVTIKSGVLNTNQWTHVTGTYSNTNSKIKLYINGEEVAINTVSGALPADATSLTLGRQPDTDSNYFNGYLDEARVFFKALTQNELQKMVYQEIEDNSGVIKGAIIPTDVNNYVDASTNIPLTWTNLKRYYRMDAFKDNVLDDLTTPEIDEGSGALIYNTKIFVEQSAPLPFVTQQGGRLDAAVNDAANGINGNDALNPSAIVKIVHNGVYIDSNLNQVGLIIDAQDSGSNPIDFKVQNDSQLNVSWYLKLDGKIDLEGESQLVQGADSYLDTTSSGSLEKDQQGTKDLFTYNYWSSPIGTKNTVSNNTSFTLNTIDLFKDGTNPSAPANITFLTSGYNGTSGASIGIADYWIWKYANKIGDSYSQWQHVRSTGSISPGEGFTMKGVANTGGVITQTQNYVFHGKPNNGDISLPIAAGNEYLVGNPYPSAIDANEFIKDNLSNLEVAAGGRNTNGNIINGVLYFWDHFAIGSHAIAEYQGGYATYTLMGGVAAISNDARINATGATGTKLPGRYIPVGQGFFVSSITDPSVTLTQPIVGGNIVFKNSQRAFMTETSGNSAFLRTSNKNSKSAAVKTSTDTRQKLRLMFDSPRGYHRQLLAGVDPNASDMYDVGYDAPINEANKEDLFWVIENNKFVIQAVDNFSTSQKLPLGVNIFQEGLAKIKIDNLENIASNINIYLHDKNLNVYHDLRQSAYEVHLIPDTYLERFEITFSSAQALGVDDIGANNLHTYFSNDKQSLVLHNPLLKNIKSVEIMNVLGQSLFKFNQVKRENYQEIRTQELSAGTYIVMINTLDNTLSKKVLIK